ncbi:hypothetical protein KR009_011128 [Drosophila setifemur]|nr:hypothetical protein KR009_011128 [Drosophila setifemur]
MTVLALLLMSAALCVSADAKSNMADYCLAEHNRLRTVHAVPPLSLSSTLSEGCEAYAKELAVKGSLTHSSGAYGENLCWRTHDVQKCTQDWYDEIADYDFDKAEFSLRTGHFTALIWKSSTEMGYGDALAGDGSTYVVVRYTPAGNVEGMFKENVPRAPSGCKQHAPSNLLVILTIFPISILTVGF